MSINDVLKNSFVSSYTGDDLGQILLSLVVSIIMGAVIYLIYRQVFYRGRLFTQFCGDLGWNDYFDLYGYLGD